MGTLREDIDTQSDWIVKAFDADKLKLDYSIRSFIEIDRFFLKHTSNGVAKPGGRLLQRLGSILFSLGAYVGNTIIENVIGSVWIVDDDSSEGELNIAIKLPDGSMIWPVQRMMKRFKNGIEDSVYVYGFQITKDFIQEEFENSYWEITRIPKPWWKVW